jgi:hypothetical protein
MFKFTHALLRKIDSVFLAPSTAHASMANHNMDGLLKQSNALLKTSDDLVNALYVPQNSEAIFRCISIFTPAVKEIQNGKEFSVGTMLLLWINSSTVPTKKVK